MSDPTIYSALIIVKVAQGEIAKANSISFNDKELRLVCWNCWDRERTIHITALRHYDNWLEGLEDTPPMHCPDCDWMDPWVWGPFGKYGLLFA